MPKTSQEMIDHAESLVARFEGYEPRPEDERDLGSYRDLEEAVRDRARAERAIGDAVARMRATRWAWSDIGSILGTSGQAAQQKYGKVRGPDPE